MKTKYKPMKARFRATYASGGTNEPRLGTVDRETRTLHDVQITLEGEAKGHGVWLDRQFCEDVAKAGNEMGEAGVKVRFGHPAMCSDAIGTYLGRATNFRVVDVTRRESGEKAAGVIADVALDEHADRTEWIMNMSESAPDTFGQSIVFTYSDWKVKDADGNEHGYAQEVSEPFDAWCKDHPEAGSGAILAKERELYDAWFGQSADGHVYAVLGKLHGTDFTDSPAATDGVFGSSDLAAEAEQMLDEHPQVLEVLEKNPDSVYQFLSRIGILDRIESKRVAGLQAEKDKQIAALQAKLEKAAVETVDYGAKCEALARVKEALVAMTEQLDAARAEVEQLKHFESDLVEKTSALESARAELEQLKSTHDETEKALAETRAALEVETKRYREQVGSALGIGQEKLPTMQDGLAQCRTPAERSAFLASGKYVK